MTAEGVVAGEGERRIQATRSLKKTYDTCRKSATDRVRSLGALVLCMVGDGGTAEGVDVAFKIHTVGCCKPLIATTYWQLFAYHIANPKGRSIDIPRDLVKSVTLE